MENPIRRITSERDLSEQVRNLKSFSADKISNGLKRDGRKEKPNHGNRCRQCFSEYRSRRISLRKGDLILQYDGIRVRKSDDLVQAVKANEHKEGIELSILGGSELRRFVTKGGPLGVKISEQTIPKDSLPDIFD